MNTKQTMAALGLATLLGGASLVGAAMAESHDGGGHGGMEGMNHGQTMEGMGDCPMMSGGATGDCPMMSEDRAHEAGEDHEAHGSAADADAAELPGSPATEAYRAANLAMHEAMELEFSGDADIDFARGMIAHHQGAIDMARVVLEHGEDPDLRALAREVVEAQEAEIAFLRDWLAQRGE